MTTPTKPKTYVLEMIMNGETFKKRTADINDAIVKLTPDFLHTEMYLNIKQGKELLADRKLTLVNGRKLFANEDYREIFVNNLMLV